MSTKSKLNDFLNGTPNQLKKIATGTNKQARYGDALLEQLFQLIQQGQSPQESQNQQQAGQLQQQGQQGLTESNQYYQDLLKPGNKAFEQFSQPYLNQFQEQTIPGLEERYAGSGALSSSGFGQAIGGAKAGLQSQLASLFASLQQQGAQGLTSNASQQFGQQNQLANQNYNQQALKNQQQSSLSQLGLNYSPFQYYEKPGKQGQAGNIISGISSIFGF